MNGYIVFFLYVFSMYISPCLDLSLFLCHKISSMMRKNFIFLLFFLSLPLYSQKSKTAQSMEAQGLIDITSLDSTIRVSLMYSRADNFTGKVLYSDLREAYLHPKAAKALAQAQKLLKDKRPDLSLIVYDAARPMTIQQKMWNVVAGTSKNIYVSNPKNGGGLHNYGMAVDITLCDVATGDTTQGEPLQKAQGTMQSPKAESRNLLYCHGMRLCHCYPGRFYNQYGLVSILCFSLSHFLTNGFYCFYSIPSPLP